jgi:hypothetical protein
MVSPSLSFLCDSIAVALIAHYGIKHTPVDVRDILLDPPAELRRHVGLTEVSFGEAIWLRLIGGQGSVFSNNQLPEPERRYHLACALFTALCSTPSGREAGLPEVPNDDMKAQMDSFARRLLLAPELLPENWRTLPACRLAELAGVPQSVAEAQLATAGE